MSTIQSVVIQKLKSCRLLIVGILCLIPGFRVLRSLFVKSRDYREDLIQTESPNKLMAGLYKIVARIYADGYLPYRILYQGLQRSCAMVTMRCIFHGAKIFFGPEHPEVATCLSNLADMEKEKIGEKRKLALYKQVLSMREKILDPDHEDIAKSLSKVAKHYHWHEHEHATVESLLGRALTIREKVFGSNHPKTLKILRELALFYRVTSKNEKAELFYQRALVISEKVFGLVHGEVSQSLVDLADLYCSRLNKFNEADSLYQRALAIGNQTVGYNSFVLDCSIRYVLGYYENSRQYERAEAILKQLIAELEKIHPFEGVPERPLLARVYCAQGKYDLAESIYKYMLENISAFNLGCSSVTEIMEEMISLYRKTGQVEEAERFEERLAAILSTGRSPMSSDVFA